ncbi:MAG: hypothetical protein ACJA1Y_000500 [Burkholderiaceae bacterium]|jgi:hypothetical protein|tara:strand:+ start:1045 stop:1149 length:105 start_codon:yes stop_codon:yes gene_type:complete
MAFAHGGIDASGNKFDRLRSQCLHDQPLPTQSVA